MEHIKLFFNSVERCLDYASQSVPDFVTCDSRKVYTKNNDWAGSKNYDHALQIAREGLSLENIQASMSELSIGMKQQELFYDVTGSYVDIGRYLEGEPENMINFQESQDVKFIDVKFLFSENQNVTSDIFTNKVIVLASIIDRLESIGYRVRLIACCRCKSDRTEPFNFDIDVIVKDYRENLAIGQISGCVSASFFRRIMFSIIEIIFAERGYNATDYGYGSSIDWSKSDKESENTLLIGKQGQPHDFSNRSKLKSVIDQIMKQYEA